MNGGKINLLIFHFEKAEILLLLLMMIILGSSLQRKHMKAVTKNMYYLHENNCNFIHTSNNVCCAKTCRGYDYISGLKVISGFVYQSHRHFLQPRVLLKKRVRPHKVNQAKNWSGYMCHYLLRENTLRQHLHAISSSAVKCCVTQLYEHDPYTRSQVKGQHDVTNDSTICNHCFLQTDFISEVFDRIYVLFLTLSQTYFPNIVTYI